MSHRTLPMFDVMASHSHLSPAYRCYGSSWSPASYGRPTISAAAAAAAAKEIAGKDAVTLLFDALDDARFDQVRRAVTANADCLQARRQHSSTRRIGGGSGGSSSTATDRLQLHVVQYALANCQMWHALAQHCRRTGTYTAYGGDARTFRERLTAMDAILSWLVQHPSLPPVPLPAPSTAASPLHMALSCRLDTTAATLLSCLPTLATCRDARGKTPMHVVCALPCETTPATAASHVNLLARHGAHADARDAEGATPLHDLMRAAASASDAPRDAGGATAYGALLRRRHWHSGDSGIGGGGLGGGYGVSGCGAIDVVTPVVDALLRHGARPCTRDAAGDTALDVALRAGLDYIAPLQRAERLRQTLCGADATLHMRTHRNDRGGDDSSDDESDTRSSGARVRAMGMWAMLPDDVVVKMLSLLSPCDVLGGIGATCLELRTVATREALWSYLEMSYCLDAVRLSIARSAESSNFPLDRSV